MSAPSAVLTGGDLRQLTAEVMDPGAVQPFGLYVFTAGQPGAELGRHLERIVFQEAFGNSPGLLAREYGPYEHQSIFLLAVDHRRQLPAGMMRVVVPSLGRSKSLDDLESVWGEPAEDAFAAGGARLARDRIWDIATLAVAGDYRGRPARGLVSLALNQALMGALGAFGVGQAVTILDVAVLRLLQWQLGRPFSTLAGLSPKPYLGSDASLAVWSDVIAWRARLAGDDPALHDLLFEGRGLDAAVAPAVWGDDASRAVHGPPPGPAGTERR